MGLPSKKKIRGLMNRAQARQLEEEGIYPGLSPAQQVRAEKVEKKRAKSKKKREKKKKERSLRDFIPFLD